MEGTTADIEFLKTTLIERMECGETLFELGCEGNLTTVVYI